MNVQARSAGGTPFADYEPLASATLPAWYSASSRSTTSSRPRKYVSVVVALRAQWKSRKFRATLRRDGYISFGGRKYDSPSAAASKATGHAMNGWVFWNYRLAPRKWVPLGHLRH